MYGSLPLLSRFSPVSVGSNKLMYLRNQDHDTSNDNYWQSTVLAALQH